MGSGTWAGILRTAQRSAIVNSCPPVVDKYMWQSYMIAADSKSAAKLTKDMHLEHIDIVKAVAYPSS